MGSERVGLMPCVLRNAPKLRAFSEHPPASISLPSFWAQTVSFPARTDRQRPCDEGKGSSCGVEGGTGVKLCGQGFPYIESRTAEVPEAV